MSILKDMQNGKILRVSLSGLGKALSLSPPSIYRRLNAGNFIAFRRDAATGRIYFDAQDILEYIEQTPKYKCTAEYVDTDLLERMELARSAKCAPASKKARRRA